MGTYVDMFTMAAVQNGTADNTHAPPLEIVMPLARLRI